MELDAPIRPLPFLYVSTGVETVFQNGLDPRPRSRRVFAVNQPETLSEWLAADPTGTAADRSHEQPSPASDSGDRARRMRWAWLLQRVFDIDALRCPRCGSTLRLIAAIEDPLVARKILECLGLPARAPPLETAAGEAEEPGHAEDNRLFDQSSDYDEP